MSLRAWWSRMRGSVRRDDALEKDMEREMAFHLDMSAQRNVRRGMTPEAAKRQAKLTFGSAVVAREEAREAHRARVAENVINDVRFAMRGLRRSPSFALTAILTVAIGIGASTAIFSVVDAVLLRPLPIPHPNDFVYIGWKWKKGGEIPALTSFQYEFVREHKRTLEVSRELPHRGGAARRSVRQRHPRPARKHGFLPRPRIRPAPWPRVRRDRIAGGRSTGRDSQRCGLAHAVGR
jgi:hypothetical protein